MSIRHLGRLAVLVKYHPKAMDFLEKKLKLREKYGNWVVPIFWHCLRHLQILWGEPPFRECLSLKLSDLAIADPREKPNIERFLKDLPKLQEEIRDFLTSFFREKAKREKFEKELEKLKKEEKEKIETLLKEVL